jgi:hypothetical protein
MARPRMSFVTGLCGIFVGTGMLWLVGAGHSVPSENQLQVPPAHFDLKALEHATRQPEPWVHGVDSKGSLRLIIRPALYGGSGLKVEVEVWNLSEESKRVFPIDPIDYQLQFRDASGKPMDVYWIPPIDKVMRQRADLTLLEPANHLGATYLLPDYRTRVGKAVGAQARVSIQLNYALDSNFQKLERFSLASGWVAVPAS